MKKLAFICFLLFGKGLLAQKVDTIFVSNEATTYLIFDEPISLFNFGSKDYEGRADNPRLLFIRAKIPFAKPSTLVLTYGEEIYTAYLVFSQTPQPFYDYRQAYRKAKKANLVEPANEFDLKLKKIQKSNLDFAQEKSNIFIKCTNLYNDNKATYLRFVLENRSSITYEVDYVSFAYMEKRKSRRKMNMIASGVEEIQPFKTIENKVTLSQKSSVFLYALPLYATTDEGYLEIIFREKNGLRHIPLKIPFKKILNAELL